MAKEVSGNSRRTAYLGILLLGIVSLMGDVIYEGSRGVVPDYLHFLGATAVVVGLVGGIGDFLGYAMRLVSGVLVDATRAYWLFIFIGYALVVSIPLLGLSSGLEIAVLLVLVERFGKAFRTPSRDTILSVIGKKMGAGKAFGLHELLDQVGAVIGPLIVTFLMFSSSNNYSYTFTFLFVPFIFLMIFLAYTYKRIKPVAVVEPLKEGEKKGKITKNFHVYTVAVLLNTIGLIPYSLILFKVSEIVRPLNQDWIVPLTYLLIQGVDAPAALLSGHAFDKFGIRILVVPFVLSLFPPLFAMFDSGLTMLILAALFFGLVLGMQESIYRAAVSLLTPISSRGTAYGIFNTAYGFGILIGGVVYGFFIQIGLSFIAVGAYVVITQVAAIASLLKAYPKKKTTE